MKNNSIKRVIIGAGPAGVNAAITLAKHGVQSIIIDESSHIGGAIFRKSDRVIEHSPFARGWLHKASVQMRQEFNKYKEYISFINKTQVVGILDNEKTILLLEHEQVERLSADHFIICTGAQERPQPFPGWNLPGVMGVGGLQQQLKAGYVKPGKRAILVGTGPLLLATAKQMSQSGIKVMGVFEAGRFGQLMSEAYKLGCRCLLQNWRLLYEGMKLHLYLNSHLIPFRYQWGIVEARGYDELEEVVVAPYDKNWMPNLSKAKTIKVDCMGVNYGWACRTHLAYLFGCKHIYLEGDGGFQPEKDQWHRTSEPGVYVAGDCAGFYGADVAACEGQMAAIASLYDGHELDKETALQKINELSRQRTISCDFHDVLHAFSIPRSGLLSLVKDDTLICRCENIKFEKIKRAVELGVKTETSLKMTTRLGMGDCQGKVCGHFTTDYLRQHTKDKTALEVGFIRPRFPLAHLPFSAYTDYDIRLDYDKEIKKHHQGDEDTSSDS